MKKPENHYRPWTMAHKRALVSLIKTGQNWNHIAHQLGRTVYAVTSEFYRLANEPKNDEKELSIQLQPYKECYDTKTFQHKNPGDIYVETKSELELLLNKKFFRNGFNKEHVRFTKEVKMAAVTSTGDYYVSENGTSFYHIDTCEFIEELVTSE